MMEQLSEKGDPFAFTVEDHIVADTWQAQSIKKPKPSSDFDNPIDKYNFLQQASSGPNNQIKDVLTLDLDEDDINDSPSDLLGSSHNDGRSDVFNAMSVGLLEDHCHYSAGSGPENSAPYMEIRGSSPLGPTAVNGDCSQAIQESQGLNDLVDMEDVYGSDSIQESSPSTSDSELEENNVPVFGKAQNICFSGSEMDEMDTVVIDTDYIKYGDEYFPASVLLFLRDSVKMKVSTSEEDSAASCPEWHIGDILRIESRCNDMGDVAKVTIRLLSKDATHVKNAESSSACQAVELVEFLVHAFGWYQQLERIMSLNVQYQAILSNGMSGITFDGDAVTLEEKDCSSDPYIPDFEEPFEEVVYPKGEIDAVSVRRTDVDLLQPEVFVNDTIIDFYITYLKNEIPGEERHRFHFFSSFFFRKLADLDKNPSSVSDGKAAFQRVRRWTRKVNIFEKDFIFIPVNFNLHWSLIILCHLGEIAGFDDEKFDEATKVPCILHMDSIRGSHAGLKDLLQSYLLEEWKERQKETSEDICSKFLNLRFLSLELPQQENCSDCGLFLLHYAELFIADAPPNFSPFCINEFDNFLKPDWFMPAEASLKRVHIQRLIRDLLAKDSNECASLPGNNLSDCQAFPRSTENENAIEIVSENRNPEKSRSGNILYAETVEGTGLNVFGSMSHCGGMTELLQQCQPLDGASLIQPGFTTSASMEVEGNAYHAHFALIQNGHRLDDHAAAGECHGGYRSREDNFSLDSDSFSDDSVEEIGMGFNLGNQIAGPSQYKNVDQSEETMNSSADGYASAASDVMETPPEDSEEMAKKYGGNEMYDLLIPDQEEVVKASQEPPVKEDVDIVVSGIDEKLLVENEVVAGLDDRSMAGKLSSDLNNYQDMNKNHGEIMLDTLPIRKQGELDVSKTELVAGDDEVVAEVHEKVLVDHKVVESLDDRLVADDLSPHSISSDDINKSGGVNGLQDLLCNNEDEASQEESDKDEDDVVITGVADEVTGVDKEHSTEDEVATGLDDRLVADDSASNSDNEKPAKRMRLTPSLSDERIV